MSHRILDWRLVDASSAAPDLPIAQVSTPTRDLAGKRDKPLKVLVIDDEPTVLEVIALMLAFDGHTVLTASNGEEGLARLAAGESVDLVLTDLMMPQINGWDVARE